MKAEVAALGSPVPNGLNVFVDVSKATFDDDDERYKCHVVCVQSMNTRTCLPAKNNVACHRFCTIQITA